MSKVKNVIELDEKHWEYIVKLKEMGNFETVDSTIQWLVSQLETNVELEKIKSIDKRESVVLKFDLDNEYDRRGWEHLKDKREDYLNILLGYYIDKQLVFTHVVARMKLTDEEERWLRIFENASIHEQMKYLEIMSYIHYRR